MNKTLRNLILVLTVMVSGAAGFLFDTKNVEAAWYDGSWLYRSQITIDYGMVGEDLTDFPVYVDLGNLPTATFWANVKALCADVRVTTSDGVTEVPREIVFCDTATDTGEMHFKGDLSKSESTIFYIYYGNSGASEPAASATYGSQNVWTNSFQAVYHLEEDPSGNGTDAIKDSTSNLYHLTATGTPVNGTGKLSGEAIVFDGIDAQLNDKDQVWSNSENKATVSVWNNVASDDIQGSNVFRYTTSGSERFSSHAPWANNNIYFDFGTCCVEGRIFGGYAPYLDKYSLVHLMSNGSSTSKFIYIDGQVVYRDLTDAGDPNVDLTGLYVGSGVDNEYHIGTIDEIRFATTTRSAGWILTEYNNQNSAISFFTPPRRMRLFEGMTIKLISDRIILYQ